MKLGVVTPWPPMRSGIAEYAYNLVYGLSQYFQITIFTQDDDGLVRPAFCDVITTRTPDFKNRLNQQDVLIYQVGNNYKYHGFMLEHLNDGPCRVVHLHDVSLNHFYYEFCNDLKNIKRYLFDLASNYGMNAVTEYRMIKLREEPFLTDFIFRYPMFDCFLGAAEGIVVHSKFAQNIVKTHFPEKLSKVIWQLYDSKECAPQTPIHGRSLRVGIFGHVDPHKRVYEIVRVVAKLLDLGYPICLEIFGEINEGYYQLHDFISKDLERLNLGEKINFRGFVPGNILDQSIAGCDLLISLRDPTVGETSAIVIKALQLGRPVVVSNVGWYAELPDFIFKVNNENLELELEKILLRALNHPEMLVNISNLITSFGRQNLQYSSMTLEYANFIREVAQRSQKLQDDPFGNIKSELKKCRLAGDGEVLRGIYEELWSLEKASAVLGEF